MGEDIDLSHPSDWRTVLLPLIAAFLANVVLIDGCRASISEARCCSGARPICPRQPPLAPRPADRLALSVITYLIFARGLGIGLPAGPTLEESCRWRRCPTC